MLAQQIILFKIEAKWRKQNIFKCIVRITNRRETCRCVLLYLVGRGGVEFISSIEQPVTRFTDLLIQYEFFGVITVLLRFVTNRKVQRNDFALCLQKAENRLITRVRLIEIYTMSTF